MIEMPPLHNGESPENRWPEERWRRLNSFISLFTRQCDHGLLIVRDSLMREVELFIAETLPVVGVEASEELYYAMKHGISAFVELTPNSPLMLMRDVKQCAMRSGVLETIEPLTGRSSTIGYDPFEAHILLIVDEQDLQKVTRRFAPQHYVGAMELI